MYDWHLLFLCIRVRILVVDEALSVGDFVFQNRCMQKIQSLKQAGTSILFVSHDLSTVQIICDRVIWIKHGRVQGFGIPSAVCQDYYAASLEENYPLQNKKSQRR